MAKILIIGDIHACNPGQFAKIDPETGLNSRFKATLDLLYWLAELSATVDLVVQVGDVFDSRTKIPTDVAALTVEAFKRFRVPVMAIPGNHDIFQKRATDNTLKILPSNVDVIDVPHEVYLPDHRLTIGFHPFTEDTDSFKKWAKKCPQLDLFFFHQAIEGALFGAYNLQIPAAIGLDDLPKARWRFGGHVHKAQEVSEDTVIVGSVSQQTFGERDEPKRVIILDTQTWEFTSIPTQAPTFHLYPGLEAARGGKHKECDFLRIVCNPREVAQAKEEFPTAQLEVQKELTKERRIVSESATSTDKELLTTYLEDKKPELNEEKLIRLGLEMLGEESPKI